MTVATLDYYPRGDEPEPKRWRDGLQDISNCLFELANDDAYELPGWFRTACELVAVHILDPVVDISHGRPPRVIRAYLRNFVDRWHAELEWGPAPYGYTAFRKWLSGKLAEFGNAKAKFLRQK